MPVSTFLTICHCNQCGSRFPIRKDKLPSRCPRCHSRRLHQPGPYGSFSSTRKRSGS